jgi:hypothetical protein
VRHSLPPPRRRRSVKQTADLGQHPHGGQGPEGPRDPNSSARASSRPSASPRSGSSGAAVLASIRRRNVPYRNRFMKLAWNWAQFELLGYYVKKPPVAQGQPGRWSTTSLGRRTRRAASRLGKPAPKQESGWLKWKAKRPRRSTHRSPAQVQRLVPARPRHLASTPPPQATNVNHDRSSQTQLRFPKLAPGETLPWPTTAKAAPDALWPSPPSDRALLQAWRDRLILQGCPKGVGLHCAGDREGWPKPHLGPSRTHSVATAPTLSAPLPTSSTTASRSTTPNSLPTVRLARPWHGDYVSVPRGCRCRTACLPILEVSVI